MLESDSIDMPGGRRPKPGVWRKAGSTCPSSEHLAQSGLRISEALVSSGGNCRAADEDLDDRFRRELTFLQLNRNGLSWVEGCRCLVANRTAAFYLSPPGPRHSANGPTKVTQSSGFSKFWYRKKQKTDPSALTTLIVASGAIMSSARFAGRGFARCHRIGLWRWLPNLRGRNALLAGSQAHSTRLLPFYTQ